MCVFVRVWVWVWTWACGPALFQMDEGHFLWRHLSFWIPWRRSILELHTSSSCYFSILIILIIIIIIIIIIIEIVFGFPISR